MCTVAGRAQALNTRMSKRNIPIEWLWCVTRDLPPRIRCMDTTGKPAAIFMKCCVWRAVHRSLVRRVKETYLSSCRKCSPRAISCATRLPRLYHWKMGCPLRPILGSASHRFPFSMKSIARIVLPCAGSTSLCFHPLPSPNPLQGVLYHIIYLGVIYGGI